MRALWSRHFDRGFYLTANKDVYRSGISPALHYVVFGHTERRGGLPLFDTEFYLRRRPDVASAGMPPLLHYVVFGSREGRTTDLPREGWHVKRSAGCFRSANRTTRNGTVPLVSVVIPCFNYGQYLVESVRSVRRQTLSAIELIVVEGGSTDGQTPAVVRQLEKAGLQRTRFLYRTEPNLPGDNRNFGIAAARGRYICCLDADDKLNPIYLEVAAFLAETYGYDLVYPSVQAFGADDFLWSLKDPDPATIADYNQVSTVAMFRRSAWEEVNGFRDFGRGEEHVAEDWEFWVRLLWNGFRAKCIPQALQLYRVHPAGIWHGIRSSIDYQRRKIVEANAKLLSGKTAPRPLVPQPDEWRGLLDVQGGRGSILLALPFVSIGGAEKIFEAIITSAIGRGTRVIVITTLALADTVKDTSEHFQTLTPNFYAFPKLFGDDLNRWDDFLSYLIDRYSVDLIMIAGCDYLYHALPALTAAFPHVGIVDQLFNDQVHFPTNRRYSRYIDVTMVPSPEFASRIAAEFGEKPDRVAVIPHGVAIPPTPDRDRIAQARERSGIPLEWRDKFLAGFFGRMSPEKAPADFVEIARTLRSEREIAFVMTGEGPELEQVRRLIREYGLDDRVFARGFVEDPQDLMVAVDAVVVPSRLDGMPLVVMESQALGKPVVAANVGSIPVMIEHGRTGLLCDPGDVEAFAARLRELFFSPAMRASIGRAARESVEVNHGAATMIRRYEEAFEKGRSNHRLLVRDFVGDRGLARSPSGVHPTDALSAAGPAAKGTTIR